MVFFYPKKASKMTVIHPQPSEESGTAEDTQTTPQPGSLRGTSETADPASRDRLHEAEVDEEDEEEDEEEEEKEGKAKQITSKIRILIILVPFSCRGERGRSARCISCGQVEQVRGADLQPAMGYSRDAQGRAGDAPRGRHRPRQTWSR